MLSTRRYRPIQYTTGNPLYHEAETHRPPNARQYRLLNWGTGEAPTCDPVCNLRAFDAADGSLLWEVMDFDAIGKSPDGSIFGYRWNNVTGATDWVNLSENITRVFTGAAQFITLAFGSSTTRFMRKDDPVGGGYDSQTWWADCIQVDIAGAETTIMENACLGASNQKCQPPVRGTFPSFYGASAQLYECSDSGLIIAGDANPITHVTDRDSTDTNHHFIRLAPRLLFASNTTNSPKWVFRTGATTVKVDLYADAATFETALAGLPGVDTVTVTGGPACHDYLTIDITFDTDTDQIEYLCIEYAAEVLRSALPNSRLNKPIWDLNTHTPKVVTALDLLANPLQLSFASESETLIGRGNWGAVAGFGRKTEVSKLTWTMPGGTPDWGNVDTKVWSATPFDGMLITADRATVSTVTAPDGTSIPKTSGISAILNGEIAVTSTTCAETLISNYKSHVVIDESSGAMGGYGWSLLKNSTGMVFTPSGAGFRWGTYSRYASPYSGPAGASTALGTGYALPMFVEVYNADNDEEDTDIHEADGIIAPFGAGSFVVGVGFIWGTVHAAEQTYMSATLPLSGTLDSSIVQRLTPGFLANTSFEDFSAYTGVAGNRPRDVIRILSLGQRFADDIEWRFWHGSESSGTITRNKTTPWYAPSVSKATVITELEAWYPDAPSTNPVIVIDPFGEDADLQDESPDLPTWQKISQIWFYRDNFAGAVLIPNHFNVFGLDIRNSTPLQTRPIVGKGLTDGVIEWQRYAGVSVTGSGTPVSGNPLAMLGDTVVFRTVCRPVTDLPVVGRGDP
jgi:hypothetical protein